jgi:hypothetical protein
MIQPLTQSSSDLMWNAGINGNIIGIVVLMQEGTISNRILFKRMNLVTF